ncbi:FAD-linked oxidase [Balamuthia mandrillaris]
MLISWLISAGACLVLLPLRIFVRIITIFLPFLKAKERLIDRDLHEEKKRLFVSAWKKRLEQVDSPVALKSNQSNALRVHSSRRSLLQLDLSSFNKVIEVDYTKYLVEVEGRTTFDDLVKETLRYGLVPAVVPNMKGVTVGGSITGVALESSSFKYGYVHETAVELEVLLGDGRVVVCTPTNDYKDLFFALPNSQGTLGYILRAKLRLIPAKKFVQLRHFRFNDAESLFTALEQQSSLVKNGEISTASKPDFIEGVMYGPNEYYLTLAKFVDDAPYTESYTWRHVYYKSLATKNTDYMQTYHFLWRWDSDWFWNSNQFYLFTLHFCIPLWSTSRRSAGLAQDKLSTGDNTSAFQLKALKKRFLGHWHMKRVSFYFINLQHPLFRWLLGPIFGPYVLNSKNFTKVWKKWYTSKLFRSIFHIPSSFFSFFFSFPFNWRLDNIASATSYPSEDVVPTSLKHQPTGRQKERVETEEVEKQQQDKEEEVDKKSRQKRSHSLWRVSTSRGREMVIQNASVPIENCAEFARFLDQEIGVSPIWICPFRTGLPQKWLTGKLSPPSSPTSSGKQTPRRSFQIEESDSLPFPLCHFEPGKLYCTFGVWGKSYLEHHYQQYQQHRRCNSSGSVSSGSSSARTSRSASFTYTTESLSLMLSPEPPARKKDKEPQDIDLPSFLLSSSPANKLEQLTTPTSTMMTLMNKDPNYFNKKVEEKAVEYGGKTLGTAVHMSSKEFWKVHDPDDLYPSFKAKFDPHGRYLDLYQKCGMGM